MAILCPKAVPRCPRCLRPIAKRQPVEIADRDALGRAVYVHSGCRPYSAKSALAPPAISAETFEDEASQAPASTLPVSEVAAEVERLVTARMQRMVAQASRATLPQVIAAACEESVKAVNLRVQETLDARLQQFNAQVREAMDGVEELRAELKEALEYARKVAGKAGKLRNVVDDAVRRPITLDD